MQKFKTTNNRCVIYARFSCHNQSEQSIEGQLNDCQRFAELHNLRIVGTYIDRALTATSDKRPDFQRMIADSAQKNFDVVLVWKLDRFSRDRYDSAMYKNKLKKNGVRVMSAMENIADTPDGILLESILEGYAEYFSRDLSQKVSRGMRETAKKHKITGALPFGYRKSDEGTYIPDELTAPAVKKIFEMYADGMRNTDIVEYLNNHGYKTSTGKPFVNQSIHRILKIKRYTGHYTYGGLDLYDENQRIIDDDLFMRAQKILKSKSYGGGASHPKERYLLSSKIYCGYCRQMMHGETGHSKSGKPYHYYKCKTRKKGGICNKSTERKSTIEDTTINSILTDFLDEKLINLIVSAVKKSQQAELASPKISILQSRLDDINKKTKNILSAIEAGIFTPTTQSRLLELEDLKSKLEHELESEKASQQLFNVDAFVSFLNSVNVSDFKNDQEKQRLINSLLYREYLWDDKVLYIYNFSKHSEDDKLDIDEIIESIEQCSTHTTLGVPSHTVSELYGFFIANFTLVFIWSLSHQKKVSLRIPFRF